jgi:hypothetical protein
LMSRSGKSIAPNLCDSSAETQYPKNRIRYFHRS